MAESPAPAYLTMIPRELRAKILEYVLSPIGPRIVWCQIATQNKILRTMMYREQNGQSIKYRPVENQYSVSLVNKQLRHEAKQLIHCQSFEVAITQRSRVSGSNPVKWTATALWLPAFSGLDLGRVRDFTVFILPSVDVTYFWLCARSACVALCKERLLPDSPLRKLRIVFSKYLSTSESLSEYIPGDHCHLLSGTAHLNNFEGLLQIFADVAGLANQCDVHVPRWMNDYPESGRILDEWEGRLGARVIFGAIPETRLEHDDDDLSAQNDLFSSRCKFC